VTVATLLHILITNRQRDRGAREEVHRPTTRLSFVEPGGLGASQEKLKIWLYALALQERLGTILMATRNDRGVLETPFLRCFGALG